MQGTYYTDWLSLLANLYKYSFIHLKENLTRTYYIEKFYIKESYSILFENTGHLISGTLKVIKSCSTLVYSSLKSK